jgi:hypothetical protein
MSLNGRHFPSWSFFCENQIEFSFVWKVFYFGKIMGKSNQFKS